jgi:outer membrane protein assembly factor BamB/tetratricopeptide (TPR) repeat protein
VLNVLDGTAEKEGTSFDRTRFHRIRPGNMTFAQGCLAVAGNESLDVFVPEARFLPQRKAEAKRQASATNFYRLGLAEVGAGEYSSALKHFRRAEQAKPSEKYYGVPVRDLAPERRYQLLIRLAGDQEAERHWDKAAERLSQAAAPDFPTGLRLLARVRQAQMWTRAGRYEQAVSSWQKILADRGLRGGQINPRRGQPQQAWSFAADRIAELVRRHGPRVYESAEKQAKDLLVMAQGSRQAEVLQRLVGEFPNASVAGPALLRLAKLHEQANQPGKAARVYRCLLFHGWPVVKKEDRIVARADLARAYEKQGCYPAARAAWQALADRHGDCLCPALDRGRKLRDLVALQLKKPAYRTLLTTPRGKLELPLLRSWQRPPPATDDALAPRGRLLVPEQGPCNPVIFLVGGGDSNWQLTCREVTGGKLRWEQKLSHRPTWAGYRPGAVIVAGPDGVQSLSLTDGSLLWEFTPPSLPLVSYSPRSAGRLVAFQLTRSSVYFLEDGRRLFALDADSGAVRWSRWAPAAQVRPLFPAGRFNPLFYADERWLVVQVGSLKRWVLDRKTGRVVRQTAADKSFWVRRPRPVGAGRLCLVPDPGQVVLFDPATGKDVWKYRGGPSSASTLVTGEPPRVVCDGKTLVVIETRNVGYQLERLDPRTGKRLWKAGFRLVPEAIDPDHVAIGPSAFYYVARNVLSARSLAGGKLLWSRPLAGPAATWRAVDCGGAVLAYPAYIRLEPKWYWLALGETVLSLPLQVRTEVTIPVLCCDPKDGRLLQRLNFPAREPAFAVQVFPHRLVVGVDGRAWGLGSPAPACGFAAPARNRKRGVG